MADEVTGPHSKMEAEGAWNNDNPEDKISRSVPVWYDLDEYVIRRVDGKVVGIAGYSDKGTYAILGGMKSQEGSKSWRPMSEKRLELIGDKPKIAGFKAKTIPNETWKEKNRQVYNFDIPPEDEMGIDSKLIEQFRNRYGEDFGIKKWFEVLKFDWKYGEASQQKSPKLSTFNVEDKWRKFDEGAVEFILDLARKVANYKITPNKIRRKILVHSYALTQIYEYSDYLEKKSNNKKLKRGLNKIKEATQ